MVEIVTTSIMIILGIETSCDETALSLIQATGDISIPKFKVISTALYSQIETHKPYGGVFPMLAKREHANNIVPLFNSLLERSGFEIKKENFEISLEVQEKISEIFKHEENLADEFINFFSKIQPLKIDMLAVTNGPGLEPALWVGINFTRALSLLWQIPVQPTNHMEGHILSVLKNSETFADNNAQISPVKFPAIALLISGGHTEIVLVKSFGDYKIIGATRDDAVGEAYDKVARILDLPYPGGPEISKLAEEFEKQDSETSQNKIFELEKNLSRPFKLPRPMLKTDDLDFSFSGLKTSVLYLTKELREKNLYDDEVRQAISKEFQDATIEVLLTKVSKSIALHNAKSLIIGGGVIANTKIRETFMKLQTPDFSVYIPEMELATDNAVMISFAGYISQFKKQPEIAPEIKASGNLTF